MAAMVTTSMLIPSKLAVHDICTFKHDRKGPLCTLPPVYSNGAASNAIITRPCASLSSAPERNCVQQDAPIVVRRSGNYKPSLWDLDYIESLNSPYKEERYLGRASELKVQVEMLIEEAILNEPVIKQLELIDDMQRLGIDDHFENQITRILNFIYNKKYGKNYEDDDKPCERDLYSTALEFRLLRQHGFRVSQDVFDCFRNEEGEFMKASTLAEDPKVLLQLYESSFLATQGESTMDQVRDFASISLRNLDDQGLIFDEYISFSVGCALKLPHHWGLPRFRARAYIGAYERKPDAITTILELAKLDYNIFQATNQEELKNVARLWRNTGIVDKLPFARDAFVISYLWAFGLVQPREYGHARMEMAVLLNLIFTVDDIFDIYATVEELELYTDATQRWDTESINQLPYYMQIAYLALFNFANEVSYNYLKDQGSVVIPHLTKGLFDFLCSDLQEAKWYHNGETPSLEVYMENGWLSAGGPNLNYFVYFLLQDPVNKEAIRGLYEYHNVLRLPSLIVRLSNDLKTFKSEIVRGDVPKALECYMHETGVSEKKAKEHIQSVIQEAWIKLNGEAADAESIFSRTFITSCVNYCRFGHFLYQLEGGLGEPNLTFEDQINRLLFEPIL
uniref:Putative terpene synthase 6 n=1 Tax=Eremophila drummondii TaxID=2652523 RepID=A0A6G9KSR1_9LAMI|nr:putative terpene synthase 6 [Eremophila drummondii]